MGNFRKKISLPSLLVAFFANLHALWTTSTVSHMISNIHHLQHVPPHFLKFCNLYNGIREPCGRYTYILWWVNWARGWFCLIPWLSKTYYSAFLCAFSHAYFRRRKHFYMNHMHVLPIGIYNFWNDLTRTQTRTTSV